MFRVIGRGWCVGFVGSDGCDETLGGADCYLWDDGAVGRVDYVGVDESVGLGVRLQPWFEESVHDRCDAAAEPLKSERVSSECRILKMEVASSPDVDQWKKPCIFHYSRVLVGSA